MLRTIIRKEILINLLTYRFVITLLLCSMLMMTSIYILANNYHRDLQNYSAGTIAHKEEVNGLENVYELLMSGITLDRRPPELKTLANGLEKVIPDTFSISPVAPPKTDESKYRNPLFLLFATPDFLYIVEIILSFIAILFVFDSISGEKEDGTLKLTLSNPVPRDTILIGKWIGGYISLLIPFAIAILGMVSFIYSSSLVTFSFEQWVRLLLLILTSLVYISLFFTLGLLISTLTHKSSVSLLVSLFTWAILVLVIPNTVPTITNQIWPLPSTRKLAAEKYTLREEIEENMKKKLIPVTTKEEFSRIWWGTRLELRNKLARLDEQHKKKVEKRLEIIKNFARITPAASFVFIVTSLSQTGLENYYKFLDSLGRYDGSFNNYMEKLQKEGIDNDMEPRLIVEDLPEFELITVSLIDSLKGVVIDYFILILFNVLLFMAAYYFFLRYDVG